MNESNVFLTNIKKKFMPQRKTRKDFVFITKNYVIQKRVLVIKNNIGAPILNFF